MASDSCDSYFMQSCTQASCASAEGAADVDAAGDASLPLTELVKKPYEISTHSLCKECGSCPYIR